MVLIHGGNAASAPHLLLPSIVPASPSRTAPARERKKWSPIGSPLYASAEDPSSSGTGLHQWMEELSGPSGPIGMQIPRAQLPFRSSARSHRPLTCDPPHRCTSPDPNPDPSPSPSPSPSPKPEQVHVPLRAADLRPALAAHAGQGPSLARRPDRRAEQRGRAPAHQGARAEQGGAARQSARQGGAAAREATEAAAATEPGGAGDATRCALRRPHGGSRPRGPHEPPRDRRDRRAALAERPRLMGQVGAAAPQVPVR